MILEHAVLSVKLGEETDFESAFATAKSIIASMPGFEGLSLSRGIERPSTYLLLAEDELDLDVARQRLADRRPWLGEEELDAALTTATEKASRHEPA